MHIITGIKKNGVNYNCMIYTNCPADPWFGEYNRYVTIGKWDEGAIDEDSSSNNALLAYTSDFEVTNAMKLTDEDAKLPIETLVERYSEIFEDYVTA